MGDWLLLVAGFGFALPQFAVGKARKPIVYFRIYCPTCLTRRTRPTLLLPTSAKYHLCFYGCFRKLEVLLFALFQGKRFLEYVLICACLTRYWQSSMRYMLSQENTRLKSFGCSVRVHERRRFSHEYGR